VTPTLLLVDGTALLVRSRRAGQSTGMNAAGVPTGPLTLFAHSAARLLRAHQPTHVLVAFDGRDSRNWRRQLFPGYKAGRMDPGSAPSIHQELIGDFCAAAGLATQTYYGFEADDVIAWAWRSFHEDTRAGDEIQRVVIAADDADLHQLLWKDGSGHEARQVPLSKDGHPFDHADVISRYGCEPAQLAELKALAGDPSDGIPGLPGVGPTKALGMLRRHNWSLPAITETMDPQMGRMIHTYRDILDLIRPLRAIDYERGMERYPFRTVTEWSSANAMGAAEFFESMQMIKTLSKLKEGSLW
jgi:5'-3' exonuclease